MTPIEIDVRARIAQREADYWRGLLQNKACRNCKHMPTAPSCNLAGGQAPPPEVQAAGCQAWEWDSIPF